MPVRILFQDEGRFGRISDRRKCWGPLPSRPQVGQQIIQEYIYSLVAVSPHDGKVASLIVPWLDTETMSIFLAHTANEFAGDFCLMFLDGAGWHRGGNLRIPPSMKLTFLPPYSPELNPVETLWNHLREHHFANRVFESLDQLEDELCQALHGLCNNPHIVQSMTNYPWISTLCMTSN